MIEKDNRVSAWMKIINNVDGVTYVRNFATARIAWLDEQLGYHLHGRSILIVQ